MGGGGGGPERRLGNGGGAPVLLSSLSARLGDAQAPQGAPPRRRAKTMGREVVWARWDGYGCFSKNRPDTPFSIFHRSNEAKLEYVFNTKVREEVTGFTKNFMDEF